MTAPVRTQGVVADTPLPATQRELVLVQRDAAARFLMARLKFDAEMAARQVAEYFPLPAVTRTREVADKLGDLWKLEGGKLSVKVGTSSSYFVVTDINPFLVSSADAIADVLHQPTETVEVAA